MPKLCTLAAGNTAANILVPDMTDFRFNALCFKGLYKLVYSDCCVAFFVGGYRL